ncbi:MAG: proline iminopeptidase-family hydrolase [Erythrobacter sp.]|nr:proline iminopeptidase-family hydrolase [Erythrobacter sp.]
MKRPSIIALLLMALATPLAAQEAPAPTSALPTGAVAYAAPDRELMVPVEGGRVWVRITGEIGPDHPAPVVFIHGGPGGTHAGFAAMLGLANERAVILYDQLGSGKSDRPDNPANWRVDRFVEELEAVRKAVGAQKWHVAGQSWGSALALEYTARYPERVASTVLGGTYISSVHWLTDANLLVKELDAEEREVLAACESDTPPGPAECSRVFRTIYSRFYDPPARPEAFSRYLQAYGGKRGNDLIYRSMWGPSEFSSTGVLRSYDATLLLPTIDGSDVLFMIGQYDSARIDTVQEFVALAPGAELAVVPGGGHGFMLDRPLETEAILRGWLRRKDAEGGAR